MKMLCKNVLPWLLFKKVSYIETTVQDGSYHIVYRLKSNKDGEETFDNIDKANKFLHRLYRHSNKNTALKNNNVSNKPEIDWFKGCTTQMYYFRNTQNILNASSCGKYQKCFESKAWEGLYGFGQNKHLLQLSEPYYVVKTRLFMDFAKKTETEDKQSKGELFGECIKKVAEYKQLYDTAVNALEDVYWNAYELSAEGMAQQRQDFQKYKDIRETFIHMAETNNLIYTK